MAKFYGKVGYVTIVETSSGIFEEVVTEKSYYGELIKNSRSFQNSGQVNDNINISNEISIISDPYANQNLNFIRYVEFMGAKWKVTNISIQHPRLVLTVGGVYNG